MYTPKDFRNEVIGKRIDMDGYFGAQCWDGYAYYMQKIGYRYANCTTTGFVKDIWNNRYSNGMLVSCDIVTVMQQGDIAVFGNSVETPFSHIAIFMKDNGNGTGLFLGQNQGAINGAFNEVSLKYVNILGAFRPKVFLNLFKKEEYIPETKTVLNEIPTDFRYESGTFTVSLNHLRIRRAPSVKGELTGLEYNSRMSVNYDGYVRREGYVWISWIGAGGVRRWMAAGELNSNNINVKPYGTFR